MVTTVSDEYDERLRRVINHGQSEKYLHTELGYNYRMTDINAAIGRVQLAKLDGFNRRRQENAAYYGTHITAPGLVLPSVAAGRTHVWHQYSGSPRFPLSRDEFTARLRERGRLRRPLPHRPPRQPYTPGPPLPGRGVARASVLSIPVHPGHRRSPGLHR